MPYMDPMGYSNLSKHKLSIPMPSSHFQPHQADQLWTQPYVIAPAVELVQTKSHLASSKMVQQGFFGWRFFQKTIKNGERGLLERRIDF